jgi:hypothetical protein
MSMQSKPSIVFAHGLWASSIEIADGRIWLRPDLFDQMEGAVWTSRPSWYIVANNDRTLQPEYERLARPNEM